VIHRSRSGAAIVLGSLRGRLRHPCLRRRYSIRARSPLGRSVRSYVPRFLVTLRLPCARSACRTARTPVVGTAALAFRARSPGGSAPASSWATSLSRRSGESIHAWRARAEDCDGLPVRRFAQCARSVTRQMQAVGIPVEKGVTDIRPPMRQGHLSAGLVQAPFPPVQDGGFHSIKEVLNPLDGFLTH